MSRPKIVPADDKRVFFFEEVDPANQQAVLDNLRATADNSLLVSRLEKDLDLKEFARLCQNIGKPKEFIKLARYTDLLLGQMIVQFDNP